VLELPAPSLYCIFRCVQ